MKEKKSGDGVVEEGGDGSGSDEGRRRCGGWV